MSAPGVARFALWYRATRRHKWKCIGQKPTSAEAYALMVGAAVRDRRTGHWIVKPVGEDPNEKTPKEP